MRYLLMGLILGAWLAMPARAEQSRAKETGQVNRWSREKANKWYAAQPWLVGCNFTPSTAINQLEMWQEPTFDPTAIDRELGWAADLGFNTVRVYLHDLVWNARPYSLKARIERTLELVDDGAYRSQSRSLEVTPEEIAERRRSLAAAVRGGSRIERVKDALASQRPDGSWVGEAPTWGSILSEGNGSLLVRFVFDTRAAMGKIPPNYVCTGADSPLGTGRAWFAEDWFDTPLAE